MTIVTSSQQTDLLNRLYQNKQKQLLAASKQGNSLLYRVLEAEARGEVRINRSPAFIGCVSNSEIS